MFLKRSHRDLSIGTEKNIDSKLFFKDFYQKLLGVRQEFSKKFQEFPKSRNSKSRKFQNPEIQDFRNPNSQKFKIPEIQNFKNLKFQKFEIPEKSKFQKNRNSRNPIII